VATPRTADIKSDWSAWETSELTNRPESTIGGPRRTQGAAYFSH